MSASVIGPYQILSQLGEGGMGVVYEAQHQTLGRRAALKVLHPQHCGDHASVQRFFHEAKAAAAIEHPGIITVYEFGFDERNGRAFIAMELLRGETLRGRLDRQPTLPEADALRIGRQIATALAEAHGTGIVHRDLKPDNVFLVPDPDVVGGERIKLLDFGIAKLSEDLREKGHTTKSGIFMGTPAYASPEQCDGAKTLGPSSDLYALGCILYHCMCGRAPFVAEGVGRVISAHLYTAPVPPQNYAAAISPGFADLLMQLLAKTPDGRPDNALVVAEQLRQLGAPSIETALPGYAGQSSPGQRGGAAPTTLSGASRGGHAASPTGGKRGWLIAAVLAVVVAAGATVFALTAGPSSSQGIDASAPQVDATVQTTVIAVDAAPPLAASGASSDASNDASMNALPGPTAVVSKPSVPTRCRFNNLVELRTKGELRAALAQVNACKKHLSKTRFNTLKRTLLDELAATAKPTSGPPKNLGSPL